MANRKAQDEAEIKILVEQINQLYKEGIITQQESIKLGQEAVKLDRERRYNYQEYLKTLKTSTKEVAAQEKLINRAVKAESELGSIADTLLKGFKGQRKELMTIGDEAAKIAKEQKASLAANVKAGKMTQSMADEMANAAAETVKIAQAMQKIAQNENLALMFDDLQAAGQDAVKSIESSFNKLPGGDFLFRKLGGDKLGSAMDAAITDGFSAMAKSMAEGKGDVASLTAGFGQFKKTLGAVPNLGKLLGIGLVIGAVTSLIGLFNEVSKKSHEISKATGMTYAQSKQLQKSAMKVQTSFDNQLSSTQDIVDVQSEMIAQFGTMSTMTSQQALEVSEIGNAFGYGAQQAAKVNAEFMRMGMSADQASAAQTEVAAEALKAGVSVGTVTKDIADNAKSTAKFFGGNVKALRKAAVQAAKMGMSIKDMAGISEKLLDIEGSLAAQFEFQALSGKQVNLDKARQLALEGDIAGATKEVLGQVGSISDFNQLSMLEKKKLAEATGMEVDQLQKSLITQEKLGDLTDEQKAAMSELNLSAEELSKLSAEEIKDKLAAQDAQKKMNASFESLTNEFKNALLPVAEAFVDVFAALSPLLKLIGKGLAFAFKPISLAVDGMKKLGDFIMQSTEAAYTLGAAFTAFFLMQQRSVIVQQAKNAALLLESAYTSAITAKKKVAQMIEAKGFFKGLASAAMTAFRSAAAIPLVGPALGAIAAAAAVALGMKLFRKTGDLAMSAGGGPIVSNPREGTIFQGTKNDEVAMGPGVIGMAQGGNVQPQAPDSGGGLFSSVIGGIKSAAQSMTGGGGDMSQVVAAINAQNAILNQLLTAMQTPPPVQIGSKVITELNAQIEVERSFTRAT